MCNRDGPHSPERIRRSSTGPHSPADRASRDQSGVRRGPWPPGEANLKLNALCQGREPGEPSGHQQSGGGVGAEQSVTSWALGRMMIPTVPVRDAYWEPFVDPVGPIRVSFWARMAWPLYCLLCFSVAWPWLRTQPGHGAEAGPGGSEPAACLLTTLPGAGHQALLAGAPG